MLIISLDDSSLYYIDRSKITNWIDDFSNDTIEEFIKYYGKQYVDVVHFDEDENEIEAEINACVIPYNDMAPVIKRISSVIKLNTLLNHLNVSYKEKEFICQVFLNSQTQDRQSS